MLRWHFGDGTTAPGSLSVRHQYPLVMDRRYSYYLVQADVSVDGIEQRIEYLTPYSADAREPEVVCLDSAGLRREAWREPVDLTVPAETSLE